MTKNGIAKKLDEAGIKVVAGKVAVSDFSKAVNVLAAEDSSLQVPDLSPLEQELTWHIGVRPKLTGKIDQKGRLQIDSEDMAESAGVLSKSFKSLKLKTFNSTYNAETGTFWMTIKWSYELRSGGSNWLDVITATYADGKWDFS